MTRTVPPGPAVIVADPNPIVRDALAAALADAGYRTIAVAGLAEVGDAELGAAPVVLLDAADAADAPPAVAAALARRADLPVIVLGESDDAATAVAAVTAGAAGYLVKSLPAARVATLVGRHLAGELLASRRHAAHIIAALRPRTAPLTPREREVLVLLGEGMGDRAIGAAAGCTARTAGHHVARIIAKLRAHDRDDAVRRARASGLLPALTPSRVAAGRGRRARTAGR